MRGELPFYANTPKPEKPQLRYCGVVWTKRGFRTFIVKSKDSIPPEALDVQETLGDPQALAQALLAKYEVPASGPQLINETSPVGLVGHHTDGGRVHTAFCVGVYEGECMLLFLTSHPSWNPYARPLRRDEAPFSGYTWNPMTYLAPVLRDGRSVSWSGGSLPQHRVEALREEFFRPDCISLVARL
jgi:hypothetical protein